MYVDLKKAFDTASHEFSPLRLSPFTVCFFGLLLFFTYIIDLNKTIKYSDVPRFAADTNLPLSDKLLKKDK